MSKHKLEIQISRICYLIRINKNTKTLRVYCIRLVTMLEKRNALAADTVSA